VRLTVDGVGEAYEQLIWRYQDRVYNMLTRMCGSAEEAEDLAQDTFMQAFRALAGFNQGAKFYTWLFRIAVNRGFSKRRQDGRRRVHEGGRLDATAGGEDGEHSIGSIIPDRHDTDPARHMDKELVKQRVREGLEQIDADYRAILVLRDIEGLDYDGIAETLSITRAAVKSRLHRARQELARLLKDLKLEST
jgi:RNA polymerase sigma-70 factor, ECF subfamily